MNDNAASHESYQRDGVKRGSNRSFGFVFAAALAVFAGIAILRDSGLWAWWLAAATVFLVAAIGFPRALDPLNRAWHRFGLLLGKVTTPIVLGLLFFATVTPTAILFRLLGKDPLRLKMDPGAATYWIVRDPPGPEPGTMHRQF
ncbi:MAG: SxtJ family membrane protein [Proteobacteria bacterium]|nr:SxtJ family membrane protein [Pseudomonadota bacterium]